MTVIYDVHDTWKLISQVYGTVWPKVFRYCVFIAIMTVIIYELKHAFHIDVTFGAAGHNYLSIMVAFLIVGRANEAIHRYWAARGAMASAFKNCRDLSMLVISTTGRDLSPRANEWRNIVRDRTVRLVRTTMCALRDEGLSIRLMQGEIDENGRSVIAKEKVNKDNSEYIVDPMDIAVSLYTILERNDEYLETPIHFLRLNLIVSCVSRFTDTYYSLTKFNSTPMPFAVANMGRTILIVWVISIPFVLVHEINELYACVFIAFMITYAFVGLECVVIELHDPFGDDPNDIEVYSLTEATVRGIKKDLGGDNICFSNRGSGEGKVKAKFKSNEWRISKWDKGLVFSFNSSEEGETMNAIMEDFEDDSPESQSPDIENGIPASETTPLAGAGQSESLL